MRTQCLWDPHAYEMLAVMLCWVNGSFETFLLYVLSIIVDLCEIEKQIII